MNTDTEIEELKNRLAENNVEFDTEEVGNYLVFELEPDTIERSYLENLSQEYEAGFAETFRGGELDRYEISLKVSSELSVESPDQGERTSYA